ncbi:unnamed protein product [Closterium sp. NIES-54]
MWGTIASAAFSNPTSATGECDWLTLHRRMGHVALPILQQLVKSEMVAGIRVKGEPDEVLGCPTCMQAKFTRYPFSSSEATAKAPLDEVVIDVVGPLNLGAAGAEYFLTIVDVYTRMTWVYVLSKKSDVSFYLGLHIERDVEKRCMRVHQRKYLEALAATFGQSEGHVATPFPSGFKCVKGPEEESVGEEERRRFHSLVGSLIPTFLSRRTHRSRSTRSATHANGDDRRLPRRQHEPRLKGHLRRGRCAERRAARRHDPRMTRAPAVHSLAPFTPHSVHSLSPPVVSPPTVLVFPPLSLLFSLSLPHPACQSGSSPQPCPCSFNVYVLQAEVKPGLRGVVAPEPVCLDVVVYLYLVAQLASPVRHHQMVFAPVKGIVDAARALSPTFLSRRTHRSRSTRSATHANGDDRRLPRRQHEPRLKGHLRRGRCAERRAARRHDPRMTRAPAVHSLAPFTPHSVHSLSPPVVSPPTVLVFPPLSLLFSLSLPHPACQSGSSPQPCPCSFNVYVLQAEVKPGCVCQKALSRTGVPS